VVAGGRVIGYLQATIEGSVATLAWVIGTPYQGRGYATEAARAVAGALPGQLRADVHPRNGASQAVARAIGLHPTTEVVDGETVWRR
jgi:RimJ/RimL family protein N-acetyltransferase